MKRLKNLRILTIANLVLLALQFELGMAANLSPRLQQGHPLAPRLRVLWGAFASVGGAAVAHALLGVVLVLALLACAIIAIRTRVASVAIVGALSFVTVALAALTGGLFVLSGFSQDGLSHGMATNFLLAFALQFVELCILMLKTTGGVSPEARQPGQ